MARHNKLRLNGIFHDIGIKMNDLYKLKNPLFTAKDLYKMVRLSLIEHFPYSYDHIGTDEVLTIFINKELIRDFRVENIESERGLTFSGDNYERYKDLTREESGAEHSSAWYVSQVSKWGRNTLANLHDDLAIMRKWLHITGYMVDNLPTDKFLQQETLTIADAAEERRRADRAK